MSEIQQGNVVVSVPEGYDLPANAGKMEAEEVQRLAKAPDNVDTLLEKVADLFIRGAPKGFVAPADVTPEMLERAAAKVVVFRQCQADLKALEKQFGQAALLAGDEAWNLVLHTYDWIKSLGKHNPAIRSHFHVLYDQFARKPQTAAEPEPAKQDAAESM